jgi:hypothetical protein
MSGIRMTVLPTEDARGECGDCRPSEGDSR